MTPCNDQFGGFFADPKRMEQLISDEIPKQVSADTADQNAKKIPTFRHWLTDTASAFEYERPFYLK